MFTSTLKAILIFCVAGASDTTKTNGTKLTQRRRKKVRSTEMVPKASVIVAEPFDAQSPDVGLEREILFSDEEPFGRLLPRHHKHEVANGECVAGAENETIDVLEPLITDPNERPTSTLLKDESSKDLEREETSFAIALQVFFPFLVAGFGTVAAGLLLDVVQVCSL